MVEPQANTGHAARVLAKKLVDAIEAHCRATGESYRALSVRADFPPTYVTKIRDAVAKNPSHMVEATTLERLAAAIGYEWKLEPAAPEKGTT